MLIERQMNAYVYDVIENVAVLFFNENDRF